MSQGAVRIVEEFRGLAYNDMINITLDEVDEYALTVAKEYNMSYDYILDNMYYSDLTVYYAKIVNDRAFRAHNDYIKLDEKSQADYVTDYGQPKPYVFTVVTAEIQKENIEKSNNTLRSMYRQGGRLNE